MSSLHNKILNQFKDIVSAENVEDNNVTLLACSFRLKSTVLRFIGCCYFTTQYERNIRYS